MTDPLEQWLTRGRVRMRQLLLLRALGAERNLRRAAERLGLAQPAATRLVRDLEDTLGVTLFERSSKGMAPTLYGEAMIRKADAALADLDAARREIEALRGGASGHVHLGVVSSIAPPLLSRGLARVKADRPGLRVTLHEGTHDPLTARVARGELDLALVRAVPGPGAPGLRYELLFREAFVVVASPGHPLAPRRRRRLTLADLVDCAWILPPETVPMRRQLDLLFMQSAGRRPLDLIETGASLTVQALLREAPLLAVMPEDAARRAARQRQLALLPVALEGLSGPVGIVMRESARPSPGAEALTAALRAEARRFVA